MLSSLWVHNVKNGSWRGGAWSWFSGVHRPFDKRSVITSASNKYDTSKLRIILTSYLRLSNKSSTMAFHPNQSRWPLFLFFISWEEFIPSRDKSWQIMLQMSPNKTRTTGTNTPGAWIAVLFFLSVFNMSLPHSVVPVPLLPLFMPADLLCCAFSALVCRWSRC